MLYVCVAFDVRKLNVYIAKQTSENKNHHAVVPF